MSEEQFWDRDCELAKHYRKATEIKNERYNQQMWLMGAYIYDALLRVSPVFHDFAKKGTRPIQYVSEPYSINEKQMQIREEEKIAKQEEKMKIKMDTFMIAFNKKFKKGE